MSETRAPRRVARFIGRLILSLLVLAALATAGLLVVTHAAFGVWLPNEWPAHLDGCGQLYAFDGVATGSLDDVLGQHPEVADPPVIEATFGHLPIGVTATRSASAGEVGGCGGHVLLHGPDGYALYSIVP